MRTIEAKELWRLPLERPAIGSHIVQTYDDPRFLTESVFFYLDSGLRRNESVVLIAAPGQLNDFEKRLAAAGWDVKGLKEKGQLTSIDAESILTRCMSGNPLNTANARKIIAGLLEEAKCGGAYSKIRAYGEMANVLWRRGQPQAAIQLEELWNDLLQSDSFSLFCSYRMDPLDKKLYSGFLQDVCKNHSAFIPVRDYHRLEAAVDHAVHQVVGKSLGNMLQTFVDRKQEVMPEMPQAQSVLFWLKEHMPATWDRVLAKASLHYSSSKKESAVLL